MQKFNNGDKVTVMNDPNENLVGEIGMVINHCITEPERVIVEMVGGFRHGSRISFHVNNLYSTDSISNNKESKTPNYIVIDFSEDVNSCVNTFQNLQSVKEFLECEHIDFGILNDHYIYKLDNHGDYNLLPFEIIPKIFINDDE